MLHYRLFVRNGDAESTNTELRNRIQKIAQVVYQERQVNSVHPLRGEAGIVQKGRKGMSNRISDDAINRGIPRQAVSPVQVLEISQSNLARRRGTFDRRVCEFAPFPQRQNARRQSHFSHGHRHEPPRSARYLQYANTIRNRVRLHGNLQSVHLAVWRDLEPSWQSRSLFEIMNGEHYARRKRIFPRESLRQVPERLHFQIAPLASRFARLDQPVQFGLRAAREPASSGNAPTGRQKCGASRAVSLQPTEKPRALRVAAEPVQS